LPLRNPGGSPLRLNLTTDQKAALVAFLKTLTDTNLATDVKLSDPFNYGN
jgi:cytochrome c peroxidase